MFRCSSYFGLEDLYTEGKTCQFSTIAPDYYEIGKYMGEQINKKQTIGIIADWKMSEAVQAEICGLNGCAGRFRKQDPLVYLSEKRTGHCGADERRKQRRMVL